MVEKIAMIGSGIIGRAYAICFSRGGYEVSLWDPNEDTANSALATMEKTVTDLAEYDLLNGHSAADVMSRMTIVKTMEEAVDGAVHVQENGPENLDLKKEIFATLDRISPKDAVIGSSSSSYVVSKFAADLEGRHRCLIVHPTNPPYAVKIVELVPAPWTDPAVTQKTRERFEAMGHYPITLKKEIPGFIMNRFQAAIMFEAFYLVGEGVASIADVDRAMAEGISQRWSFIGPIEVIDLSVNGGFKNYPPRYAQTVEQYGTRNIVPLGGPIGDHILKERRELLPEAKLAERQRWRDKRLMALAQHKKWANENIE